MDEEKFREVINQNKGNPKFIERLQSMNSIDELIAFSKDYNIAIEDHELDKILATLKYFVLNEKDMEKLSDTDLDISGGTNNINQNLLKMFRTLLK